MRSDFIPLALLGLVSTTYAQQQQPVTPQLNTFGSNFSVSATQAKNGGIDNTTAQAVSVEIDFERSNWATGSIATDEFYDVPKNATNGTAGSVLKVQLSANASLFTLPPEVALSRILYMTEDLNGTAIPTSAFVLWPYLPRTQPDGTFPVVAWAHGTSGFFGECGPSHYRNLFYEYTGLFELALQGYVVVATDFAGLGVNHTANGDPIYHPYLVTPSVANDIFYAVEAAQSAFPKLSKQFVVMGHSQGGAAAWGAAIRQAQHPVAGYLGTVAASPPSNLSAFTAMIPASAPPSLQLFSANAIRFTHPDFNLSTVLTPAGIQRLQLFEDLGACNPSTTSLLPPNSSALLAQPHWRSVPEVQQWLAYSDLGGQAIAGPMLVLQGQADPNVPFALTSGSVAATCAAHPASAIEYHTFANVTHYPVLYAAQRVYLDWIADRFAGKNASTTCNTTDHAPVARPADEYQGEVGYFLEYATQVYETQ